MPLFGAVFSQEPTASAVGPQADEAPAPALGPSGLREEQINQRCEKHVQEVKQQVQELRQLVRGAKSHREKCCNVLSAAMAASLALEQACSCINSAEHFLEAIFELAVLQVLYSGKLDSHKEAALRRLCSRVRSALDLGEARIKVYGGHSRLKKYIKLPVASSTSTKFEEVISELEGLVAKAWKLSDTSRRHVVFLQVKAMQDCTVEMEAAEVLQRVTSACSTGSALAGAAGNLGGKRPWRRRRRTRKPLC